MIPNAIRVGLAALCIAVPAMANELGPIGRQVMLLTGQGKDCPPLTKGALPWTKPLKFSLVALAGKPLLLISGTFTAGDSIRLGDFLTANSPIAEVWFDSGGGDAAEGPKVGEVLRSHHLATRVASGYACISSCSMAFLGGTLRYVDTGALYGIHTFYDDKALEEVAGLKSDDAMRNRLHKSEQGNAILAGEIQRYGQKMGISRDFFPDVMFRQRSLIYVSDKQIVEMAAELKKRHTGDEAVTFLRKLLADGVLYLSDDKDERSAQLQEFGDFLQREHTQDDVLRFISPMLQTFQCPSRSVLNKYNVINVVSN